jgi:predicted RND superfamily exporter protein
MTALARLEARVAKVKGVKSVFGPATLVRGTLQQIPLVIRQELGPKAAKADQAAREARRVARQLHASPATADAAAREARLRSLGPARQQYEGLFERFAALGVPSLTNAAFVQALMLGAGGEPKARLRWLLPDAHHALVVVRLRDDLPVSQVRSVGRRLGEAARAARADGLPVTVVGAPLVAAAMADQLRDHLLLLLPLVIGAMFVVLIVRRRSWRGGLMLTPAIVGVGATVIISWVVGLGLTPATLAALPVILGLGVDFVVQLEARYRAGRARARAHRAAAAALEHVGPVLGRAALAMMAGFAALLFSPVPVVQRLGILLAIGTLSTFVAAMLLTPAVLVGIDRGRRPVESVSAPVIAAGRSARLLAGSAAAVLICGLVAGSHVRLSSNPDDLASRNLPELKQARQAASSFGASGQIRIAVRARDVTAPGVVRWMDFAKTKIAALDRRLRPGPSLAELLTAGGRLPQAQYARQLLAVMPPAVRDAVLSRDHHLTEFTYTVPLIDGAQITRLNARIDGVLATAPHGVTATAGGLAPTAGAALAEIRGGRPWLMLAAALAALLSLTAVGLGPRRAAVIVIPAMVAASMSSLVVLVAGARLSPLSACLEPLLIAIAVEFAVLVEDRSHILHAAGVGRIDGVRRAVGDLAPAILTSAVTVACGFAVLLASAVPVLRQFGAVAAIEVLMAALVALTVTPALILAGGDARSPARAGLRARSAREMA